MHPRRHAAPARATSRHSHDRTAPLRHPTAPGVPCLLASFCCAWECEHAPILPIHRGDLRHRNQQLSKATNPDEIQPIARCPAIITPGTWRATAGHQITPIAPAVAVLATGRCNAGHPTGTGSRRAVPTVEALEPVAAMAIWQCWPAARPRQCRAPGAPRKPPDHARQCRRSWRRSQSGRHPVAHTFGGGVSMVRRLRRWQITGRRVRLCATCWTPAPAGRFVAAVLRRRDLVGAALSSGRLWPPAPADVLMLATTS